MTDEQPAEPVVTEHPPADGGDPEPGPIDEPAKPDREIRSGDSAIASEQQ